MVKPVGQNSGSLSSPEHKPIDQKNSAGEHSKLGQVALVNNKEKAAQHQYNESDSQSKSILSRRISTSNTPTKSVSFNDTELAQPDGVEAPDTREAEKAILESYILALLNASDDPLKQDELHELLVMQYINEYTTKSNDSARLITFESLSDHLRDSSVNPNKTSQLDALLANVEQTANQHLESTMASMRTPDEVQEKISKLNQQIPQATTESSRKRLMTKLEIEQQALEELEQSDGVNQRYDFTKGKLKDKAPELWALRDILDQESFDPVKAQRLIDSIEDKTTLESMKLMLSNGHYKYPDLDAAIEAQLKALQ
ncbi:hypothetical protein [Endozoicomonas ascidiicola]|uniref:hypothetical protein n=1 Tax=Endozoicomonas ascidiicola TaxID=1698521 RepID=UPI00082FA3CE|nr:hypothetical protein [Endozoicomonas ascidiicola]